MRADHKKDSEHLGVKCYWSDAAMWGIGLEGAVPSAFDLEAHLPSSIRMMPLAPGKRLRMLGPKLQLS
jgi:hypothetical protein